MRRRALFSSALTALLCHTLATARSATSTFADAGVSFVAPVGWSAEDEPDGKAILFLLLSGPNAADASMMIELFTDRTAKSLTAALDDALTRIRSKRPSTIDLRTSIERTPIGLQFGHIRYSVRSRGTVFDEQYMTFPIREGLWVNVFATYPRAQAVRHEPATHRFLHSLRVAT